MKHNVLRKTAAFMLTVAFLTSVLPANNRYFGNVCTAAANDNAEDNNDFNETIDCVSSQTPKFGNVNLTLGDALELNFYLDNIDDTDGYTVKFDGKCTETEVDITRKDDKYYASASIFANNMDEDIKASLYNNGIATGESIVCSVNKYLDTLRENISDSETLDLIDATQNLGLASENYFNGTEHDIPGIPEPGDISEYEPNFYSCQATLALVLDSKTSVRLYIDDSDEQCYEIPGLNPLDLASKHTVNINGMGYRFSALSWCYRVLKGAAPDDTKNLNMAKSVLAYYEAAKAYAFPDGQEEHTVRHLYVTGDSTAQPYSAKCAPQQGWAYYLRDYFNDDIKVVNKAISARSSKLYYEKGDWQIVEDALQPGDFVILQFAINDKLYTNALKYAPVCGDVDNPEQGSYEWFMTKFIKGALEKGATPILVSSTVNMNAYSTKRNKFSEGYPDYKKACVKMSEKYDVPYIDLNALMVKHYNSVGYEEARSYYMLGVVEDCDDGVHFNYRGAYIVAGIFAADVKAREISELSQYLL